MFKEKIEQRKIEQDKNPDAVGIVHLGDYSRIKEELLENGLMSREKERIKVKFSQSIELSDFPTKQEKIWDLLTILELYDTETVTHSIRTYQIAKEKIEKVLSKNIVLGKIIESEGVDLERFYFACLTHDIGKIEIPHFIIQNQLTKEQWDGKLEEIISQGNYPKMMISKLGLDPNSQPTETELRERIKTSCLCPNEIVPVRYGLEEKEIEELESSWKISADLPLMDIIEKHAEASGDILKKEGFPVVAEIVRNHHHQPEQTENYKFSVESLQISSDMSDILHLADVEQALSDIRHYKGQFAPLEVIKTLVEHAETGKIGKEITYLWVKDSYKTEERQQKGVTDLEQQRNIKKIEDFIAKFESGKYKQDLDNWINLRTNQEKISA